MEKTDTAIRALEGERTLPLEPQLGEPALGIHHIDCRLLDSVISGKYIDVTITSPPYFDLKDYGANKQIGFGQTYEQYLSDVRDVFRKVYHASKDSATLWLVVNTYRRHHELIPLPFDLARTIRDIGWRLQDVIIWKKERTVPWVPKGKTRSIFEYVLFFSKQGQKYKYYSDRVRECDSLKGWWIRYPERYNPSGKLPDEIWEYDIPLQGSWGAGEVRHFCPLPPGLVGRILDLASDPGDIVLDPFAGSGAVLLEAEAKGRRPIGFETNLQYVKRFVEYRKTQIKQSAQDPSSAHSSLARDKSRFRKLILDLRLLKFARVLYKRLRASDSNLSWVLAEPCSRTGGATKALIQARYVLLSMGNESKRKKLHERAERVIARPPLSKFGINAEVKVISHRSMGAYLRGHKKLFGYRASNTHQFVREIGAREEDGGSFPIISPLRISIPARYFAD